VPVISVLRVLVATALGLVAYFHLDLAGSYTAIGDRPLSLGDQFYAQSAAAIVLAVLVLVPLVRSLGRLDRLLWLGVAGFGVVSLGPLVYSRYNPLPLPLCSSDTCQAAFPDGWQESWDAVHAQPTAVVEVVVIVGALVALALTARRREAAVSAA
jgi:hypothetical protein